MSVISYLERRATQAVLSSQEEASIQLSLATLKTRLKQYFPDLKDHFAFGSWTRGTILPRSLDAKSDIDYMVVFADGGLTPQAYLDRLKRFALFYYNSSEIRQSTPTIVLELNHIRFELVPATHNVFLGYQIPNGSGGWQSTDPNDFNKKLTDKNKENAYLIKPTIRLAKCWNALNDYPFESYALEKEIVGRYFGWCANNQRDFLFHVINSWDDTWFDAQRRRDCKARAKKIVAEARALEDGGYPALAEKEVRKLLER